MALLAALGMLIAGSTFVHLGPLGFLLYWFICFGFTLIAIMAAFLDAMAVRHRLRQERRDLLQTTIKTIETEARERKARPPKR
jgi:hypothetical protein